MKKILPILLLCLLAGCSSEEGTIDESIKIDKAEYTLNFEDEAQILATSPLEIEYSSENEFVAKVSDSSLITGGRVGETIITLNNGKDSKDIKVLIEPRHNIFPEPIDKIAFGASPDDIKKAFGTPDSEAIGGLLYRNHYSYFNYIFLLGNDKLTGIGVIFPTLSIPSNLIDFLNERYVPIETMDEYNVYFLNDKKNMTVIAGPLDEDDPEYFSVTYHPRSNRSARSLDILKNALCY